MEKSTRIKRVKYACLSSYLVSPGSEVIKLFSCSTQLSMKFQLLIKAKILTYEEFLALSLSDVVLRDQVSM